MGSQNGQPGSQNGQVGRAREQYAVVASAVQPEGSAPMALPQAVAELFPEHFPTATSAKRACRRGEILVDGAVSKLKFQRCLPAHVACYSHAPVCRCLVMLLALSWII